MRIKDHALIRIIGNRQTAEVIAALPDNARFMYIGFTGEHCCICDMNVTKSEEESPADFIPRIAEEISYINVPAGDIPNIQADGYRSAHTEGIPVKDGMKISFHAMSLPTARLVWHCPYVDIFTSKDGKVNGPTYRDLMFMRFDGECWECDEGCSTKLLTNKNNDFSNWDAWKTFNKNGYDCEVTFSRHGNSITISTENAGISVNVTVDVDENITDNVYTALTGDQVAITDIRISY